MRGTQLLGRLGEGGRPRSTTSALAPRVENDWDTTGIRAPGCLERPRFYGVRFRLIGCVVFVLFPSKVHSREGKAVQVPGVRQRVLPVPDAVQPPEQSELDVPGHDRTAQQPPTARRRQRPQAQDDHGLFHQFHIEPVNKRRSFFVSMGFSFLFFFDLSRAPLCACIIRRLPPLY